MNTRLLLPLIFLIQASALSAAETTHTAQIRRLTEQRDNALKAAAKPIDAKYHELLAKLQKSAAAAGDFEAVTTIQKILKAGETAATMEDYFPAGSRWIGVWSNTREPEVKVKYAVIESRQDRTIMEFENQFGKWKLGLHLRDESIHLESVHGITIKNPPQFFDILISGMMTQKHGKRHLELNGRWKFKIPGKMAEESPEVRFVIEPL